MQNTMKKGGFSSWARRLIICLVLVGFFVPSVTQAATLQELLNKQSDLRKQAEESRKKIDQKKREAGNLQETISDLNDDVSYTESRITNTETQIALSNQVIVELGANINQNQEQLNRLNSKLKSAYVHLYELSRTSTIEMVLQSNSITDALTQAQYVQSLQDSLKKDIDTTNQIMADLNAKKKENEGQKAALEGLNNDLNNQRSSLSKKRNQKSYLLGVTQGEQAKYEELWERTKREAINVDAQIQEYLRKFGSGANGGGYDYGYREAYSGYFGVSYTGPGFCPGNDGYNYCIRQCVSYAAYRWETLGYSFRSAGNANNWDNVARANGYTLSNYPKVNSIAVWDGGTWGHVAVVESVDQSRNAFSFSQYNVAINGYWGLFSTDTKTIGESSYGMGVPVFIYPK